MTLQITEPATKSATELDDGVAAVVVRSVPQPIRFGLLVGAAVLVGFALRLAIGLTDTAPSTDETAYLRSGEALVNGEGFERAGKPELHFPPLVPFLVGTTGKFVSDPHVGTVVLTCITSTALILPLALLARRVAGPVAGAATAWIAALTPGVSTALVNRGAGSEAEYLLLVVTALWLVVLAGDQTSTRRRLACMGAAGLFVGFAYLTRPEGLFVAVPLGLAAAVLAIRGAADQKQRVRMSTPVLAAFALPLAVCVIPYATYLHDNTGKWELTAKTQDASIEAWHAVAHNDRETRDSILYKLDETGTAFDSETSSLQSLAREDPWGYLAILRTNIWRLVRVLVNPEVGQVLGWRLFPAPIWILAALGAWRYRHHRKVRLLLAVAALPVATALIFFVQPRYLVVVVALSTVLVGAAIPTLSPRYRRPVLVGVLGLLALSSVQAFRGPAGWWHPIDYTDHRRAGQWIEANSDEDDRIMTRSMVVEYYAERPAMAIPYAEIDEILNFARYYGARYLVVDEYTVTRVRPQLEVLSWADSVPGLVLAHELTEEGRTTRIFRFDPPPADGAPMGPSLGFVGDG